MHEKQLIFLSVHFVVLKLILDEIAWYEEHYDHTCCLVNYKFDTPGSCEIATTTVQPTTGTRTSTTTTEETGTTVITTSNPKVIFK